MVLQKPAPKKLQERPTRTEVSEFLTGTFLHFRWWDASKAFDDNALAITANALSAKERLISASHKIIDTKHERWQALVGLRNKIRTCWVYHSLPYVRPGIRLMQRHLLPAVRAELEGLRAEVEKAALDLELAREELIERAEVELGELFRPELYPSTFRGLFGFDFDEQSIEPPSYLMHTNAEEYRRQLQSRIADVQSAVQRFEQECWRELATLTGKLREVIQAKQQGDGKIYTSQVEAFQKLFDRTAKINFSGTKLFNVALGQCKQIMNGVTVEELRQSRGLQDQVKEDMDKLVNRFDKLREAVVGQKSDLAEAAAPPADSADRDGQRSYGV